MRMRTTLGLLAAVALAATGAACGSGSSSTKAPTAAGGYNQKTVPFAAGTTMDKLSKAGSIKVGVKYDQPGLGQMNPATNKPEGFDIEVAKIVAAALGIPADKVAFSEAVSKNREAFIQNGTDDIIVATYSITDARKQVVAFAGPYYVTGQDLMVKKDEKTITGPDTMAGKKICSVTGSTPLANIQKNYPQATAVPFATYTECVQQLLNGSVDAVTTDGAILLGYAARQPSQLKVIGKPFSTEKYGIGLKKEDTEFRKWLNDVLDKAFTNGDWAKAYGATLGKSGSAAPQPPALDRY
jgi:glutamate transport system substrate-binding protein